MRIVGITLVTLLMTTTDISAQSGVWLDKMFKGSTFQDFGNVPHGAQLYHRFPMTNIWAVPLEISIERVSCGCVTATLSSNRLQPRESGFLDVTMDARRFTGPRTVTIYITVGPQYISTTAVRVSAHSRADVVFNPGQVNFGVVQRGQTPEKSIDVEYAGVLDWHLKEVDKGDAPLDVTFDQLYRQAGKVGYRIRTTLKADAPPGLLRQDLVLKTNDPASPLVPVLVEAMVQAPLTVKPSTLQLGNPKVGETVTKRVNVYASKAFKILAIDGLGNGIQADIPKTPAPVQMVTFTYQATQVGEMRRQLQIKTDLPEQAPVSVTIVGNAVEGVSEKP